MPERFREPPGGSGMIRTPWLVRCPRCSRQAAVVSPVRLSCSACGLARDGRAGLCTDGHVAQTLGRQGAWRRDRKPRRHWPIEHSEIYELWLRTSCCGGEIVWAANEDHLRYLESYIGADLREGSHRPHQALHHKLPAWMKSAKHRDEVLAALRSLRARLSSESD